MRKHPKCIDYKDYIVRDSEYVQTSLLQTRDIMRQFGKSYFLATKFLPKRKKLAVYNLYKLVRIPDLVVDTPHIDSIQAKKDLQELYSHRLYVYNEKSYSDRIFGQAVHSFYQFDIKSTYVDAFFGAMWMDTDLTRYQSYRQLCDYMYGSAEVVGLMMCDILGMKDKKAIPYAQKLGRAMQLTNFLRDIAEDYVELDRIYMPQKELEQFGLSHDNIIQFCNGEPINNDFIAFMQYYIQRCDDMYQESFDGLKYLSRFGRQGIYIAGRLYQGILRKIERQSYDVFSRSARTTSTEKFTIAARYMLDRSRNKKTSTKKV